MNRSVNILLTTVNATTQVLWLIILCAQGVVEQKSWYQTALVKISSDTLLVLLESKQVDAFATIWLDQRLHHSSHRPVEL